ncbi:MAG: hypothetical protein ACI4DY_09085 [Monoglobaceae bacterium]
MLEQVKYQNHLGEEISFSENGIYVKSSDLHDYSWSYAERGGKISSFKRDVIQKKIEIVILCDNESAGIQKRNLLIERCEKDVIAKQPGKIIVNGYYLKCYVIASEKSGYLKSKKRMYVSLILLSDEPFWIKEVSAEYNSDYQMTNPLTQAANFRLKINGLATSPAMITIGGTNYGISDTVASGETLVIDSLAKEVYKLVDGEKVNVFNKRLRTDSNDYVFRKIPAGSNTVRRSSNYTWSMILYDERSEPKWI